jgi:hypothetical protein
LKAERKQLSDLLQDTKRENRKLKQQLEVLRAGELRTRIEKWRSVILDFDFAGERFAGTDTYSQMKREGLRPEVVEMFEAQRTIHVGNEARGDPPYRHTLLDEVARIEKERGLI